MSGASQHPGAPPSISGCGILAAALATLQVTAADTVLADSRIPLPPLAAGARIERIMADRPQSDMIAAIRDRHRHGSIVAIGGGRVLDSAKIARALINAPATTVGAIATARERGFAQVPTAPERTRLILVPTTIGTGSEASSVACLEDADGRRLLVGPVMRSDAFVLDGALTRTLPAAAVTEGAAEIVLRLAGAALGSDPDPDADDEAATLIRRMAAVLRRTPLDDGDRLRLARVSAATHAGAAMAGRNPFASRHWYLANELSTATKATKIAATFAILPGLWQRILAGDQRWGDATRLRYVWSWIAEPMGWDADPLIGVREWAAAWRIQALDAVPRSALDEAAGACAATWGGRRPMLPGIAADDIGALYHEAASAASTTRRREEVRTR